MISGRPSSPGERQTRGRCGAGPQWRRRADCPTSTARRSQPSLHCDLRPILSLRHQLPREQLACGLPCERANERSERFIATISRRTRPPTSRSPITLLSRSDHNAATPSRVNRCVPHECDSQPGGHHVIAEHRRSRGSVRPKAASGDGAKRSGLTEPRTAGQSRVVMAAADATFAHVSELARRSGRAGGREAGGGDRQPPQSESRACARSTYRTHVPDET